METWHNTTDCTIYVTRIGEYGKRSTELVYGRRNLTITPQERRINQQACAIPEQDVFTNGTLQPTSLIDGEPDTERLRSNPNMLDTKEIDRLFKLRGETFQERIGNITNIATIARLLELARDPRRNATVHQYEILRRRERAITGEQEPKPAIEPEDDMPRAVTPK